MNTDKYTKPDGKCYSFVKSEQLANVGVTTEPGETLHELMNGDYELYSVMGTPYVIMKVVSNETVQGLIEKKSIIPVV